MKYHLLISLFLFLVFSRSALTRATYDDVPGLPVYAKSCTLEVPRAIDSQLEANLIGQGYKLRTYNERPSRTHDFVTEVTVRTEEPSRPNGCHKRYVLTLQVLKNYGPERGLSLYQVEKKKITCGLTASEQRDLMNLALDNLNRWFNKPCHVQ